MPAFKRYRHALRGGGGIVPPTWWTFEDAGHTDEAKKEIRELDVANDALDFVTPKPTRLIQRILQIATNPGDLVLDSFAGSGTTGHAVLQMNEQDSGNRRFILIEMQPNIAQSVTAERLKRAISGYREVEGLGGGFRYCTLGPTLFDAEGQIRTEVTFSELAQHVFFVETGEPLPRRAKGQSPLLGVVNGLAVYLLYNGVLGDKSPQGGNILTRTLLADLPPHDGPKVIYGEGCRLAPERLKREGITFRQIPYEVRVR